MIVVEHQKIELDYCHKCSGIWVDSGEMELLVSVLEAGGVNLHHAGLLTPEPAKVSEIHLKCPICRRKMEKSWLGESPGVLIDKCPQGDGLWFDSGELQHVLHESDTTGTPASRDIIAFLGDAFKANFPKG